MIFLLSEWKIKESKGGVWPRPGRRWHWPRAGESGKGETTPFFFFRNLLGRLARNTRLERDRVVSAVGRLYTDDATLSFRCESLHRSIEISLMIL